MPKWHSFQSSRKVVKQEPLKDVVSSFPYRVNNYLDGRCPLLPEKEIHRKVEEMIDTEMDNSMGNKEFVTHLRYGVAYSEQVRHPWGDPLPGLGKQHLTKGKGETCLTQKWVLGTLWLGVRI